MNTLTYTIMTPTNKTNSLSKNNKNYIYYTYGYIKKTLRQQETFG